MSEMESIVYNTLEDMPDLFEKYEKWPQVQRSTFLQKVAEYLENDVLDGVIRDAINDKFEEDYEEPFEDVP